MLPGERVSANSNHLPDGTRPAYIQHNETETAPIICPGCIGLLPMFVREVEPHWSMAKIDFIYECSDCGAEVRQTITKPERRH